jgi:hypothetical protein
MLKNSYCAVPSSAFQPITPVRNKERHQAENRGETGDGGSGTELSGQLRNRYRCRHLDFGPDRLGQVYAEAEQLGARFTAKLNTRWLDTLHVAFAIIAGYTSFVTCDGNQPKLAKAAGLSCTLVRE